MPLRPRAGRLPAAALATALVTAITSVGCAGTGSRAGTTTTAAGTTATSAPYRPSPAVAQATYAVGSRDETFVDTSRPTPTNRTYPGAPSRTLPTLILYPATGPVGGGATPDAPPASGRFPLVVFAHGFTADGPIYSKVVLEPLVARGYIVAAPTFPLSNGKAPGGPTLTDTYSQPGDMSFVITQMLALNRGSGTLHRHIDASEIAVGGHSLGAITTLGLVYNTCCQDARIKAAFALSGALGNFKGTWNFPPVPLLLVHGNKDRTVPYTGSTNAYVKAKAPKLLLTLEGAPHTFFLGTWETPFVDTLTAFLNGFLKQDHAAIADIDHVADVPGVSSLQESLPVTAAGG